MRTAARRAPAAACLACACMLATAARAATDSVEITFVGPRASCEALMSAVASVVGSGDSLSQTEQAEPPRINAARDRVVIDVVTAGTIRIFVSKRDGRTLVRAIDAGYPSPVTAEIVAQIVRETTNALHAQSAETEPTSFTPPRPVVPAPTPSTVAINAEAARTREPGMLQRLRHHRLGLSLDYVQRATIPWGVLIRDAPAEQGLAGTVVFGIPRPYNPFFAVMAGWTGLSLPPIGDNLGTPGVSLDRVSTRALLGLALPLESAIEIRAAAGFGGDILRVRAGDTAQGTLLIPTLTATLQALLAVPYTRLVVQGSLTLDLQPKATFSETTDRFLQLWIRVDPPLPAGLHDWSGVATMTRETRVAGRLSAAIVIAGLAGSGGCGDYNVDLGQTVGDGECRNGVDPGQGSSVSIVDAAHNATHVLPVVGGVLLRPQIAIRAELTDFQEGSLTIRAWGGSAGPFRCEDAATAGRTRIVGFGTHPAPWRIDTLEGGTCVIRITHNPTLQYPDGSSDPLEGNFTATAWDSNLVTGSFVVTKPCWAY